MDIWYRLRMLCKCALQKLMTFKPCLLQKLMMFYFQFLKIVQHNNFVVFVVLFSLLKVSVFFWLGGPIISDWILYDHPKDMIICCLLFYTCLLTPCLWYAGFITLGSFSKFHFIQFRQLFSRLGHTLSFIWGPYDDALVNGKRRITQVCYWLSAYKDWKFVKWWNLFSMQWFDYKTWPLSTEREALLQYEIEDVRKLFKLYELFWQMQAVT